MAWKNLEHEIDEMFSGLSGRCESEPITLTALIDREQSFSVDRFYVSTLSAGTQAQVRAHDRRYFNKNATKGTPNPLQAQKTRAAKQALGFYPTKKRYANLKFFGCGGYYLSQEKVAAISNALASGLSLRKTAALVGCSRTAVIRYKKLLAAGHSMNALISSCLPSPALLP